MRKGVLTNHLMVDLQSTTWWSQCSEHVTVLEQRNLIPDLLNLSNRFTNFTIIFYLRHWNLQLISCSSISWNADF